MPVREIADSVDIPVRHLKITFLPCDTVGICKVGNTQQGLAGSQHQLSADSHFILERGRILDQCLGAGEDGIVKFSEIRIRSGLDFGEDFFYVFVPQEQTRMI